jgi:hypothetical protein
MLAMKSIFSCAQMHECIHALPTAGVPRSMRRSVLYALSMSRPARPHPRELAARWPDVAGEDPIGEVARLFAQNLRSVIGTRSLRAVEDETGVDHTTILAVLDGRTWPDLATIAKLEAGTKTDLWPGRAGGD